jgi:hypothetical protein
MILKVLRSIVMLTLIGTISYYIASTHQKDGVGKHDTISKKLENSAKSISYTMKIKGGILTIKAGKVSMKTFNKILLTNVAATFTKKTKSIEIRASKCTLMNLEKKAYLSEKIQNTSNDGMKLNTSLATIDWGKSLIYGNSKISGTRGGIKLSADGFHIKENGEISLKHVKIGK